MKRRDFLQATAAVTVLPLRQVSALADDNSNQQRGVMTVSGKVPADQLGRMLPHEHVLVDFVGADKVSPERYDADEAYRIMLPYVKAACEAGCQAIAECTPAYLGRDPKLLHRLPSDNTLSCVGLSRPKHGHSVSRTHDS